MFQHLEKTSNDILDLILEIKLNWQKVDKMWCHIRLNTSLINQIGFVLISSISNNSVNNFLLLSKVVSNFNSSIKDMTNFLNQYNRYVTNYMSYDEYIAKLEYKSKPINVEFDGEIKITYCRIECGKLIVKFDDEIIKEGGLTMRKGTKILIKGQTGHGKSTFINAFIGKSNKTDELIFHKHSPENYHHLVVDMYQNIREKLPTSNISIRELFDNEPDDTIIMECLKPCFSTEDLDNIFSNLSLDKKKDNSIIDNPLDIDINERLSGGEKTRIALSTRIYQMISKKNKEILILDEPEQGLDPEVAIRVINNIFEKFIDKTIIMITHICDCNIARLDIQFDYKLKVDKGVISKFYNKIKTN